MSKKLTMQQLAALINNRKTLVIKGFEVGGKKKEGKLLLTPSLNIELEEKEEGTPVQKKEKSSTCPKCKIGIVLKGNNAYGCSNWKTGCNLRLPFEFLNKKLTETQIQSLIKNGKTPLIKGFANNGVKVNGYLKLTEMFELKLEV
jgi:DNA topoisomerase-3